MAWGRWLGAVEEMGASPLCGVRHYEDVEWHLEPLGRSGDCEKLCGCPSQSWMG